MDWKAIVNNNLENKEIKKVNLVKKENIQNDNEDDNRYFRDPDFEFDYKYSEGCYNSINRFKKYILRINEPLFDLDQYFVIDLYNFIKYNSYEYTELYKSIENESEDEEEDSDEYYDDENF